MPGAGDDKRAGNPGLTQDRRGEDGIFIGVARPVLEPGRAQAEILLERPGHDDGKRGMCAFDPAAPDEDRQIEASLKPRGLGQSLEGEGAGGVGLARARRVAQIGRQHDDCARGAGSLRHRHRGGERRRRAEQPIGDQRRCGEIEARDRQCRETEARPPPTPGEQDADEALPG